MLTLLSLARMTRGSGARLAQRTASRPLSTIVAARSGSAFSVSLRGHGFSPRDRFSFRLFSDSAAPKQPVPPATTEDSDSMFSDILVSIEKFETAPDTMTSEQKGELVSKARRLCELDTRAGFASRGRVMLATVLSMVGEYREAISTLESYLDVAGDDAAVLVLLTQILLEHDDETDAAKIDALMRRAIVQDPNYMNIVMMYISRRKTQDPTSDPFQEIFELSKGRAHFARAIGIGEYIVNPGRPVVEIKAMIAELPRLARQELHGEDGSDLLVLLVGLIMRRYGLEASGGSRVLFAPFAADLFNIVDTAIREDPSILERECAVSPLVYLGKYSLEAKDADRVAHIATQLGKIPAEHRKSMQHDIDELNVWLSRMFDGDEK